MSVLLKSRKLRRFFDRRFEIAQAELSRTTRADNVCAGRPTLEWTTVPELSDVRSFYSFHDQSCPDVADIPTERFWRSHFFGRYQLHLDSHASLAYELSDVPGGVRFRSPATPDTWIYLVSRRVLPTAYAIEFDYRPDSVFKEQLQLDWAATSLAERHRFILAYNEYVRYQRVARGLLPDDVAHVPCSLPLGRASRVRLEIVARTFALSVDGRTVCCYRDAGHRPRPSRGFLLFWNGHDERAMDFQVTNFTFQVPRTT